MQIWKSSRRYYRILLLTLLCLPQPTLAGVTAEVSRIVFTDDKLEQSLLLANLNEYPVLVQLWVNDGDVNGTPDTAVDAPVIPLPAIMNLAPMEKRSIRLIRAREDLPQDRESLYWLNIYEVPPQPSSLDATEGQWMVLTMHTQMKLLFRPLALMADPDSLLQPVKLEWKAGGLIVSNSSPFYRSLTRIVVPGLERELYPGTLGPFSSTKLNLQQEPKEHSARIYYLDDNGVELSWFF